jgi:ribosome-associated protein
MLYINQDIQIPEKELFFEFIRSSRPGGQNVNKVATAAQLRFNVEESPSLPQDVKERLLKIAKNKINNEGELVITAKRYRTQDKNRKDAIELLIKLITSAAEKPKIRKRRTRLSMAAKKKRMEVKRKTSEKKQARRFKAEY